MYNSLGHIFPRRTPPTAPSRILLVQPCCIGDVVMATAALDALRHAYPNAHITWAVGSWSRPAIEGHPLLDDILDTGPDAHPVATPAGFRRFVEQVKRGGYDLAVSLVRSPKMSAALLAAGIPYRAGIDSAGRGFGYNIRSTVNPNDNRHEVDIYLDVVRALGVTVENTQPMIGIDGTDTAHVLNHLNQLGITGQFIVVNPSGGKNPGAQMDAKRYPPDMLARLVDLIARDLHIHHVIVIAAPGEGTLAGEVSIRIQAADSDTLVGQLSFREIGALAMLSQLYIGNDTGLTHLAAAAGAYTAMILGPTHPARYGPYNTNALALWKPHDLPPTGFAGGAPPDWDWARDGISPEEAAHKVIAFLKSPAPW